MNILWLILLIIIAANGAPIVMRKWFGRHLNHPVDMHYTFFDGNRLFGDSKTWLGAGSILLVATVISWIIGLGISTGLIAGIGVISGDLFSSFIKRRMGMRVSSMALGLDQIPESLFPYYLLMKTYNLSILDVILGVLCFLVLELLISHLLYRWHVREKPY